MKERIELTEEERAKAARGEPFVGRINPDSRAAAALREGNVADISVAVIGLCPRPNPLPRPPAVSNPALAASLDRISGWAYEEDLDAFRFRVHRGGASVSWTVSRQLAEDARFDLVREQYDRAYATLMSLEAVEKPEHAAECSTSFRGCAPWCPKRIAEET